MSLSAAGVTGTVEHIRQLNELLIKTAVEKAARELQAVKAEQVYHLLPGRFEVGEDGEVYPLGEDGLPIYRADGKRLGTEMFVLEFLRDNRHLRRRR